MPQQKLIAAKDQRYGTRMLKAGDPLELASPLARIYNAIGAVRKPTAEERARHWPDANAVPPTATVKPKRVRKRAAPKAK